MFNDLIMSTLNFTIFISSSIYSLHPENPSSLKHSQKILHFQFLSLLNYSNILRLFNNYSSVDTLGAVQDTGGYNKAEGNSSTWM